MTDRMMDALRAISSAGGRCRPRPRARGDRGEGVISAAIAVLIMAGIGALMWVGFKAIWEDTEDNTKDKVTEIGE